MGPAASGGGGDADLVAEGVGADRQVGCRVGAGPAAEAGGILDGMGWRRRHEAAHDIVTRTEREQRDDDIATRRRRYFAIMIPCLVLVGFGFFVPAPTPVRVGALALAGVLPPIAAITGTVRPW